jgi:hypothetical protein
MWKNVHRSWHVDQTLGANVLLFAVAVHLEGRFLGGAFGLPRFLPTIIVQTKSGATCTKVNDAKYSKVVLGIEEKSFTC